MLRFCSRSEAVKRRMRTSKLFTGRSMQSLELSLVGAGTAGDIQLEIDKRGNAMRNVDPNRLAVIRLRFSIGGDGRNQNWTWTLHQRQPHASTRLADLADLTDCVHIPYPLKERHNTLPVVCTDVLHKSGPPRRDTRCVYLLRVTCRGEDSCFRNLGSRLRRQRRLGAPPSGPRETFARNTARPASWILL